MRGTAGWDEAMLRARNQAEGYAKALPASEGWQPLLIVVDVGYSIEIFADFSETGKAYVPFPDWLRHRIARHAPAQCEIRSSLPASWREPPAADRTRDAVDKAPSRRPRWCNSDSQ